MEFDLYINAKKNKKTKIKLVLLLISTVILFTFLILSIFLDIQKEHIIKTNNTEEGWIPVSEVNISNVSKDIIGYLSIPKFDNEYYMNMPIKEGVGLDIMATAIGHFTQTPHNNGNICFAAHNSGRNMNGEYVGYFDRIKDLTIGDSIYYNNLFEAYEYKVISNAIIDETDLSVLNPTTDNIITLITCVDGNKTQRQCVVAKICKN